MKADWIFAVSIVLFFTLILLTYNASQEVTESRETEERTLLVLKNLEKLLTHSLDIETGARGYAITGNESFLEPYYFGKDTIWILIDTLKGSITDNTQRLRMDTLEILLREKISISDTVVLTRSNVGADFAFQYIAEGEGKRMMDSIRSVIRRALSREVLLLTERSNATDERRAARGRYFVLFSIAALLMILMAYSVIRRNILKLQETRKVQQELIEELSYQNKQLDDFASITSHNVRGPASTISMLTDYGLELNSTEGYVEALTKLKKVSGNLMATLDELLGILQVKKNKSVERSNVDFEQFLNRELENLQAQTASSRATITTDFQVRTINYPKVYLESIMHNLISNALKYRSPDRDPVIHVATEQKNGVVLLSVSDNGLGLDLVKYGDKLFGMRKTFHEHPEARGMGLFMTRVQIEALGGKITVESKPGEGTKFIVRF